MYTLYATHWILCSIFYSLLYFVLGTISCLRYTISYFPDTMYTMYYVSVLTWAGWHAGLPGYLSREYRTTPPPQAERTANPAQNAGNNCPYKYIEQRKLTIQGAAKTTQFCIKL